MGVALLPQELDGVELVVEAAFGADPSASSIADWTWTDITTDVRFENPISITRGRSDEASTAQPSECTMTLDNTDAAYSLSSKSRHWPHVRRNVPVRVRVSGVVDGGLSLPGLEGSYAQSGSGDLDVSGGLDVRVELEPQDWRPEQLQTLAARYGAVGERSWVLFLYTSGALEFGWSETGDQPVAFVRSSAAIPADSGRLAVAVTLDVDDGGDHTITFSTAPSMDGEWTVLETITRSGTTSVVTGDMPVTVGAFTDGTTQYDNVSPLAGTAYALQVRDGIDGTLVVDADFAAQDENAVEFTDATGNDWSLDGLATLATGVQFFGYATSWKPSWNTRGNDATVELTAAGVLRRLDQRRKPLRSSMFRDLSNVGSVVAYWPLEDGGRAGLFASGLTNSPATLAPTNPDECEFADFEDFPGSDAIPTVGESAIVGPVPWYTGANDQRLVFLLAIPEDGMHEDETRLIARVRTEPGGAVVRWDVDCSDVGHYRMRGFDEDNAEVFNTGWVDAGDIRGRLFMATMLFEQNGSDTVFQFGLAEVGYDSVGQSNHTEQTFYGRITQVQLGDRRGSNGTAFGHVAILNGDVESAFWDTVRNSLVAWEGETATDRLRRLADEQEQPLTIIGSSEVLMGPQPIDTFLNLLRECETADMGVLYDGAGIGLTYRARSERENVPASVTVDVDGGDLFPEFEPTDDDQRNVNEATASQVDGSSVTVSDRDGPLGIDAIGKYDEEIELNVSATGALRDYARWLVHLGTVEGYRFPTVTGDMRATPHHAAGWLEVAPSSRVDLTNVDAVFPQLDNADIRLLVEGAEVELSPQRWRVVGQCSPFDPWRIIVLADEQYHGADEYASVLDTVASHVGADASEGDTSLDVVTNAGPRWTEKPEAFPFDIAVAGTRVQVENVAPAVADEFERTETDGWGEADTGQPWDTTLTGDPGDYAVTEPSDTTPPEIVSSSVVTADAAATSVTAAGPPQVAAGDLLLAVGGIDTDGPDGGAGFTGPPEWDLLSENLESANALYGKVWGRLATEDDEADGTGVDYTWGFEDNSSGVVVILAIRNYEEGSFTVDPVWHFRDSPEPATNDDDAQDAPSITPGDEALVINMWGGQTADDTSTYTLPSSVDEVEQANGGDWVQLAVGAHVHDGSGDTGTTTATVAGRSFPYTSLSLAISPEAGDRAGGAMTLPATGEVHWAQLGDLDVDDFDVTVEASIDQEITGDGGAAVILSARFDYVADTLYFAWLRFDTDGTVATSIGMHDDAPGEVFTTSGRTLSNEGTPRFRLRFAGNGTNLRAKMWYADEAEPDSWHVAVTHTAHTHGAIALGAERGDGNTNTDLVAYFHEFTVNNPQTFTVESLPRDVSSGEQVAVHAPTVLGM